MLCGVVRHATSLTSTLPISPRALPLQWGWAAALTPAWLLAFLAALAAPMATLRPASYAAAACAYTGATFAAAYAAFHPWAVFESMWCWLAVGGFAVPLLMGRPAASGSGSGRQRRAAQR